MELLTNELREMLPPLYSQEHEEDPLVICKFFTPDSNWTFYALEFDGEDLISAGLLGLKRSWVTSGSQSLQKRGGRLACRLSAISIFPQEGFLR